MSIAAALLLIVWLLAMLYVGPTYFRRLGGLIDRLETHHPEEYERLGRPSLKMLKMTIGSGIAILMFVLRKDYLQLSDDELASLGNAARWRLLFSAVIPVVLIVTLAIAPPPV